MLYNVKTITKNKSFFNSYLKLLSRTFQFVHRLLQLHCL